MDLDSPASPNICAWIRGKAPATSMSFHEDGAHLFVTSEADGRLQLINTVQGTSDSCPIRLERDGVQLVRSTHHDQCVLCTTSPQRNQGTNSILYLSLYDNKILRQFSPANSGTIHTLSLSPVEDLFLSASTDRVIRLYDLSTPKNIAELTLPSQGISSLDGLNTNLDSNSIPCAAFDSSGLVFAASSRVLAPTGVAGDHLIHLYDARKYDAPFSEFRISSSALSQALLTQNQATRSSAPLLSSHKALDLISSASWTNMTFSPSGKAILVTADHGLVYSLDSFEGSILHVFMTEGSSSATDLPIHPAVACYSSDDKSILCGNENGTISCWDASSGRLRKKLDGHTGRVTCIQSNPKLIQLASACTNVALWLW